MEVVKHVKCSTVYLFSLDQLGILDCILFQCLSWFFPNAYLKRGDVQIFHCLVDVGIRGGATCREMYISAIWCIE